MTKTVSGFSKFSKEEKIKWVTNTFFADAEAAKDTLTKYWNKDLELQQLHDEFIENTISNFYLPYGVAPNFNINGRNYVIPMAVEESSVVAAASLVAKFWSVRGGFKSKVISTTKIGQVHFMFDGDFNDLKSYFQKIKSTLLEATSAIII